MTTVGSSLCGPAGPMRSSLQDVVSQPRPSRLFGDQNGRSGSFHERPAAKAIGRPHPSRSTGANPTVDFLPTPSRGRSRGQWETRIGSNCSSHTSKERFVDPTRRDDTKRRRGKPRVCLRTTESWPPPRRRPGCSPTERSWWIPS